MKRKKNSERELRKRKIPAGEGGPTVRGHLPVEKKENVGKEKGKTRPRVHRSREKSSYGTYVRTSEKKKAHYRADRRSIVLGGKKTSK